MILSKLWLAKGGCIAGGGQPINRGISIGTIKKNRIASLYKVDNSNKIRNSYENNDVIKVYHEFLTFPNSKKAHELLHTTYISRASDLGKKEEK